MKGIYSERLYESLVQMSFLSNLDVGASDENEILVFNGPLPNLQKLCLNGRLAEGTLLGLQAWGQNLWSVRLYWSQLREDPLPSLSRLENLTSLLFDGAYNGEKLEFLTGWFPKLKNLYLWDMPNLMRIEIHQRAMVTLEVLVLDNLSSMSGVPDGIEFLLPLQRLTFRGITCGFLTLLQQCPGLVGQQYQYFLRD